MVVSFEIEMHRRLRTVLTIIRTLVTYRTTLAAVPLLVPHRILATNRTTIAVVGNNVALRLLVLLGMEVTTTMILLPDAKCLATLTLVDQLVQ